MSETALAATAAADDPAALVTVLLDRLTLLEGRTLSAAAAEPVPELGEVVEEEPETQPYPARQVLDCRKVSQIPHRRNNPVARPVTAKRTPELFDLEGERGWQSIKQLRAQATHYEYRWLATGVSYLFDTFSELRVQCARQDIPEAARVSLASVERHGSLALKLLVNRLDFLRLLASVGATDPGLVKYAEEKLVGTSQLPIGAADLLAAVKEYKDRRTLEVLKAVSSKAAKDGASFPAEEPPSAASNLPTGVTTRKRGKKGGGKFSASTAASAEFGGASSGAV